MFAFRWLRRRHSDRHHSSLTWHQQGCAFLFQRHFVRSADSSYVFSYLNGAGVFPSLLFSSTFSFAPPSLVIIPPVNHSIDFLRRIRDCWVFFRRFLFLFALYFFLLSLKVIFICVHLYSVSCIVVQCYHCCSLPLSSFHHSSRNLHSRTPPWGTSPHSSIYSWRFNYITFYVCPYVGKTSFILIFSFIYCFLKFFLYDAKQ